nr:hypothetical protein [Tanacetum cinerariifolium]
MCEEYTALIDNETWVLVPRPPNVNIVYSIWLYKYKYNADRPTELGFSDFLAMLFEPVSITAKPTCLFSSFTRGQTRLTYYYLGPLNYFLGIFDTRTTSGIFLSGTKYATEIIERAQMLNCNPCKTPVDTKKKLGPEGSPSTTSQLIAYSDADWARVDTLSRSSVEAEYRGVANVVAETSWIRNLLRELHTPLFTATLVYCDNVSTVYMSENPGRVIAISQSIVLSLVSTLAFPSWILFVSVIFLV